MSQFLYFVHLLLFKKKTAFLESRSIPVLNIGCEGIGPEILEILCPSDSTHGMFPQSFTRKGKDPGPETV